MLSTLIFSLVWHLIAYVIIIIQLKFQFDSGVCWFFPLISDYNVNGIWHVCLLEESKRKGDGETDQKAINLFGWNKFKVYSTESFKRDLSEFTFFAPLYEINCMKCFLFRLLLLLYFASWTNTVFSIHKLPTIAFLNIAIGRRLSNFHRKILITKSHTQMLCKCQW